MPVKEVYTQRKIRFRVSFESAGSLDIVVSRMFRTLVSSSSSEKLWSYKVLLVE